jgi:beta-glucosidase
MSLSAAEIADWAATLATARRDRMGCAPISSSIDEHERLWCLDGDAPTWAGVGFLSRRRLPQGGVRRRRGRPHRLPGHPLRRRAARCRVGNATAFPVTMARGATWDPELEERIGEAIGRELRAVGANLTGAVCINVLRHPAWGRAQETYGEDPFHVGELGAALTRGLQRHVMACVKHFACNSMENARFSVDIEVDDVALHEVYLPHFRRIVDEGVASVMSAYNSVNGEWCGPEPRPAHRGAARRVGLRGVRHQRLDLRPARRGHVGAAGLDVEMPYRMVRAATCRRYRTGEASWADVDRSVESGGRHAAPVRRGAVGRPSPPDRARCARAPHLAREVAGRSVVLLRNEPVDGVPVLPLRPDAPARGGRRLADTVNLGDGGSSDVWDLSCETVLDGLRDAIADVAHDDGTDLGRAAATVALRMSRSSWSATPTSTKASTSARPTLR